MKWQPIETAPKGSYVERPAGKGTTQTHVPVRIIAALPNGDWTVTYWHEKSQRWSMFTKDAPPKLWCVPPPPPEAE